MLSGHISGICIARAFTKVRELLEVNPYRPEILDRVEDLGPFSLNYTYKLKEGGGVTVFVVRL